MFRYVRALLVFLAVSFTLYLALTIGDALFSAAEEATGTKIQVIEASLMVLGWAALTYAVAYALAAFIHKRER